MKNRKRAVSPDPEARSTQYNLLSKRKAGKGGKSLLGGGPQEDDLGRAMKVTAWAMRAKPFGCHVSRWALHLCGFQLHTPNSSLSATQTPMQGHSTRYPIGPPPKPSGSQKTSEGGETVRDKSCPWSYKE